MTTQYGTTPGDDKREAVRDDAYWKRQGFDGLTKALLFICFPTLLLGMLAVLWWVSDRVQS